MKITKRQLRRIIREEKARLLRESVADMSDFAYYNEERADEIANVFEEKMENLAIDEPDVIADPASWANETSAAAEVLRKELVSSISNVISSVEERLHNGDFAR